MNNDKQYTFSLRVEIEDTDAHGVVYHSNYLNYMERARNAWVLDLGFRLDHMVDDDVIIVVRRAHIEYLSPARFNDMLDVTTQVVSGRRTSAVAHHEIRDQNNAERLICQGEVVLVCVNKQTLRPQRFPESLL